MANGIVLGGSGTFLVSLLANGNPFTPPAGSTYVFAPTLTASDPNATISPNSGVSDSFDVSVPAGDANTSTSLQASAVAPDGTTITQTISVPYLPVPQAFTLQIVQTA